MEKIPNVGNAVKIVSLLENDIFHEVSLNQLSKLVSLDYKTIRATSQQLLDIGILKKNIRGKGHFISLNLRHYDIKTYLSFAAYYNRLTYFQKNKELNFLLEEIKNLNLGDSSLILFGSQVIRKQGKSSDVDLLLLTDNKSTVVKVKSLLSNYNLKSDLISLAFKQYQNALQAREFNLVNQVLEKHIILYDPELYWELTLGGL